MRTWLAGLAATIALVFFGAAIWERSHDHWWQFMVSAFLLLIVSVTLLGAEENAKEEAQNQRRDDEKGDR